MSMVSRLATAEALRSKADELLEEAACRAEVGQAAAASKLVARAKKLQAEAEQVEREVYG